MRMWDIALFATICINLAIAVIADPNINILGENINYNTQYQSEYIFNDSDFENFNTTSMTQVQDYAAQASAVTSMMSFVWSLIVGFVFIYHTLTSQLYFPTVWAGFYQTIVYIIYATGFFSLLTGRHPDAQL